MRRPERTRARGLDIVEAPLLADADAGIRIGMLVPCTATEGTGQLKPGGPRSGLDPARQLADKLTRPIRNGVTHCLRHHSSLAYRAMHQPFLPRTATPASRSLIETRAVRGYKWTVPWGGRHGDATPTTAEGRACVLARAHGRGQAEQLIREAPP